jgi:dCTP deaminase
MVLSNKKIKEFIESGDIFVGLDASSPYPMEKLRFDTTSIDLHLDSVCEVWRNSAPGEQPLDPSAQGFKLEHIHHFFEKVHPQGDVFVIAPGKFLLFQTKEFVRLSKKIVASIDGRSVLARMGLAIHITAPNVHAGFSGKLTLEVYNHSPRSIILRPWSSVDSPNLRIAQLVFSQVDGEVDDVPPSNFQNQNTPTGRAS